MREACGEGGSQTYIVHKTAIGASQGRYNEDITHEYGSNGLSLGLGSYRSYSRRMSYYHDYSVIGGNVAYQFRPELAHGIHTIGIGIWVGREQIGCRPLAPGTPFDVTPTNARSRIRLHDFNPYLKGRFMLGHLAVGYRAGLHLGQLRNGASILADSSQPIRGWPRMPSCGWASGGYCLPSSTRA